MKSIQINKIFFYLLATFFMSVGFADAAFEQGQRGSASVPTQEISQESVFEKTETPINIVLAVIFIFSIIGLAFSGIKYLIASGSLSAIESAKSILFTSLIGLGSSLAGYIFLNILKYIFLK